MSRQKKEARADRPSTLAESAAGSAPTGSPPVVRWLPAPRKRPVLLGILTALYLVWLLALAGIAVIAR